MQQRAGLRLLLVIALLSSALIVRADTADDIRAKIDSQNAKIAALEKEIAAYEATLIEIGKNKSTLQNEVTRLDTSRKQIGTVITVTQDKITSANLKIENLGGEIGQKETSIKIGTTGIENALRTLRSHNDLTLLEQYFSADGFSSFWDDTDRLVTLERTITDYTHMLAADKAQLAVQRDSVAEQRAQLASLKSQLTAQKVILDQSRKDQAALLTKTKSTEASYQQLLKDKQAAREQFEQELNQYQSQLKYTLDPSSLPASGAGVLSFPLDPAFMNRCKDRQSVFKNIYCITQYFGNTAFAQSGAYNGQGHNGVDFGAPEGTKIVSAASGTVVATGNTDAYKGCYSYGKWVLVKHTDGLSSLYAHLSYISVTEGTQVPVGGLLGYSGKTGYATGPHLHFTLFASDGVKLVKLGDIKAKTNCAGATVPVAPTGAYLNPMSYL